MNSVSNTSRMKKGRKIVYLRHRKISSISNKSQLSHSRVAVAAGYKKRISALLKNNKTLANALQISRQELSDVKNHLETNNKHLNKMMFVQCKMLNMHSTLQSFVKDFDETLQLLKQDDTRWPSLGYIKKCREDFRNKMQSIIDPVEEVSERESILVDPEVEKCSVESKKSSNMVTSTPVAPNSKKVFSVLQTELDKETRKESNNLIVSEDVVDCDQENNVPAICEKLEKLNGLEFGDFVPKSPVFPALECGESNGSFLPNDGEKKNSDDILPGKEMEITATPELSISCPSVKSVVNLNASHTSTLCHPAKTSLTLSPENMTDASSVPSRTLLSVKAKNSKIPKFKVLSDVKKRACLFTSNEKPNCAKILTQKNGNTVNKSNSDFCQMMPFNENTEMASESTNHECSNNEGILTAMDSEVTDVESFHCRKTFVIQKSESVNFVESQSNRRKTFVKKTCKTNRKSLISNVNKRKTFVVTKKDDVDESVNNSENCSTVVSTSASDNIIRNQNITHSLGDTGEISSILPVAPVLNITVSTSSTEEFNIQSTEMLTDKNKIPATNHFQESQLSDEHKANMPVSNCVEVPSAFYNKENGKEFNSSLQSTERLISACMISAQNSLQELHENDQNGIPVPKISCSESALVTPTKIKCSDFPADQNVTHIPDPNIFLESEISGKKENEGKVIESPESNLQEFSADDNENVRNEKEINQNSDVMVLKTLKLKRKSINTRQQQKMSSYNFKLSSDSEDEVICLADFDFDKDIPLVKDPPVRRRISKSKPPKVFVFDANKRKSSFFKNKQSKLKPKVHDEKIGDVLTQSNNDIVSNKETQNIHNTANIKVQKCKKKKLSVQFAEDTYIDENNIANTESKTCKNKFDNLSKQPKLPTFSTNEKQKTKDIRESDENLVTSEIKAEMPSLCPEADTSASCQTNIFSDYTNISKHDQNECIINYNRAKSKTSGAVVEMHCSDIENKGRKPKKLQRKKQKLARDSISLDDCLPIKRNKLNSESVDEDVSSQEITLATTEKNGNFDSKRAKKETKSKVRNVKKKVNKLNEDVACTNTILVHAEIHPPPPYINRSNSDSSCKENMEVDKIKSKRLSVVLSDVFRSKDIMNFNISYDKELFLSNENSNLPSKTPLSENSSNIQAAAEAKHVTMTAPDSDCVCVDEIKTSRRRAHKISYKEPSLTMKMRR